MAVDRRILRTMASQPIGVIELEHDETRDSETALADGRDAELGGIDAEVPLVTTPDIPNSGALIVETHPDTSSSPGRVGRWASAALAPLTSERWPCFKLKPLDRDLLARSFLLLALVVSAAGAIVALFKRAPVIDSNECAGLSMTSVWKGMFPKFVGGEGDLLKTARRVWMCADAYQRLSPEFVLAAYCAIYVGMQTFAIPGPLVLSIIAGALWGALRAQLIIAFCATTGATLCYGLSNYLARPLIERFLPGSLAETRQKVRLGTVRKRMCI